MKCLLPPGCFAIFKSLYFLIPFLFIRSAGFGQVDARFTTDTLQGCTPFTVHCTSTANENVTKWEWTTSDGQRSAEQNPVFVFTKTGKFRIKLKTSNYSLSDSATRDVTAYGIPANFTYQYNSICSSPVPVQFVSSYTESQGNYHWDFGDSTVSIEANPNHVYQASGAYRIQLITYSQEGCIDSSTKTLQTGQVTVDFDLPSLVCTNTSIVFSGSSSSIPKSAMWEIDGKLVSSVASGFTYRFTEPGTYTVRLTEDFGGCTFSKTKQVTVLRRPVASFTETGTLKSCVYPVPVQFANASQHAESYSWDFGDGNTTTIESPLYNYTSQGRFTPVLVATSANGCADTVSKHNLVFIGPPIINSLVNLPRSRCLPDTLKTAAVIMTPEAIASYDWDFGNGDHSSDSMPVYMYTRQGYYDVSLIVTTVNGCTDTFSIKKAVSVGDSVVPDFTVDKTIACATDSFHFNSVVNGKFNALQWNFGETYISSALLNPAYRYHSAGSKTVSLAVNNNGCYIRTIKKDFVTVKPPVANIGVIYDCTNQLNVVFKDSSNGPQSWRWNFGDGTPETTSQNPLLHAYTASGIYTVTLHTTNAECASSDTIIVPVLNNKPVFTFEPADGYVCRKASVIMGATNPDYISDYYWNFDNGKSAFSTTSISTYYDKAGTYYPSLVTKYKNGCRDTLYSPQPVRVTGPTAGFNTGVIPNCVNEAVTFIDKSTTDGAHDIVRWQWNCGDTYTETRTTPVFGHDYKVYGNYKASLLITDSRNCTDTAYYTVRVNKLPAITVGKDTFVCSDKNQITLAAAGGTSYIWNEDASLSCTGCAAPVASPSQSTMYVVAGADANGCTNTDTVQVTVVQPFNMSVLQQSAEMCETQNTLLKVSGADLYSWQPTDGLSNAASASPYASPLQTTKYVVTGSDKYHCFTQKGEVLVTVHPKPVFNIDSSLIIAQKGDINLLLTTGSDNIVNWKWSPSAGLSCTDCPQPYATAVKSLTYTAVVATDYGCTDTDKVSIHVLCNQNKIYLPTAFTPNNDGRNDWFYVMSNIDNPVLSFVIYSRNGERVFMKTNFLSNAPEQGWNGMYKGQPLPQETYIYRIEVKCNDEVVPFTGTVTIVR